MLRELVVDSKTFRYLPVEVLKDLHLHRLRYKDPVLLFLEEYDTAYTMLTSWEKPLTTDAVVTGYPGIGKTYLLLFVLLKRLSSGLPTAVQSTKDDFILFTESGPEVYDPGDSLVDLSSGTWALADSNTSGAIKPCFNFQTSLSEVFVVQTTSPQPHRYKQWTKQREEHSANFPPLTSMTSLIIIIRWGPSARTCLALARGTPSLAAWEQKVMFTAGNFAEGELPLNDFDPSDISDVLFSIHPRDSSREIMEARIATDHILDIVLEQLTWFNAAQQADFFNIISGHPLLKSPLGNLYGKINMLDSIPMPSVPRVISLSSSMYLQDANQNSLPSYWRQVSTTTFTSLTAIVCTATMIFLVQSTVSPRYELKKLGLEFIRQHIPTSFWKNRQCCVGFIIPDKERGIQFTSTKYTILKDFLELELRYCILPVGTSDLTLSQLGKLRQPCLGLQKS
ncbi:hypothetical protein M413DRAFT_20980 [Hebeloma cylindrosporum]|uniref:Uncharacterized protein n=1 Tax=Hebeloma cylindrosporum TaxID=76867 RepID=A0A0C3CXU8_HEBCY|nr:hypothetical protein M413DRAFT_20980 [Hebeloma cylindrosporum h7]